MRSSYSTTADTPGYPGTEVIESSSGLGAGNGSVAAQHIGAPSAAINTPAPAARSHRRPAAVFCLSFTLIAPDLLSDTDISTEESALDAISAKLESLGGAGGDIEECQKDAAAQTTGPAGRLPFPPDLAAYLPSDFVAGLPTTASFLPDYYYGQGQAPDELAVFQARYGIAQDPNKAIQNDDVVQIDNQPIPNALAGLENLIGIY